MLDRFGSDYRTYKGANRMIDSPLTTTRGRGSLMLDEFHYDVFPSHSGMAMVREIVDRRGRVAGGCGSMSGCRSHSACSSSACRANYLIPKLHFETRKTYRLSND